MLNPQILKLPHVLKNNLPYISCDQLASLFKNPKLSPFDDLILFDARSPFEYEAGHIKTAQNIISTSKIIRILNRSTNKNVAGICYCQLSQSRGPKLYQLIRDYDYEKNVDNYPNLSLPQLYILDGGYTQFNKKYPSLCVT